MQSAITAVTPTPSNVAHPRGERRAAAARDYLASLAVGRDRSRTISYGEERPVCAGSDEACWSQNRRSHFVITARRGEP